MTALYILGGAGLQSRLQGKVQGSGVGSSGLQGRIDGFEPRIRNPSTDWSLTSGTSTLRASPNSKFKRGQRFPLSILFACPSVPADAGRSRSPSANLGFASSYETL